MATSNKTSTKHAAGPSAPETIKTVEALAAAVEGLMLNLAARWMDEREHEDIADYKTAIEKVLPTDVAALRMSKRPFGVVVQVKGAPQEYLLYVTNRDYGWKRADVVSGAARPAAKGAATKGPTIESVLRAVIPKAGKVSWSDIVGAVNGAGLKVTNWLTVRNVLQGLMNNGFCYRTASIREEAYTQDIVTKADQDAALEVEMKRLEAVRKLQ